MDDKIGDSQSLTEIIAARVSNSRPLVFFFLFTFAFLSYFYVLGGDFIGDDIGRILESPDFISTGWTSLFHALTGELRDRPLLMFSLWLDKVFFHHDPFFMRLENLFLLAGIGLQLFSLQLELFKNRTTTNTLTAFVLSLVFVLHPLHSQSVTMIIQRGILFSSFFALISLRLVLKYFSSADFKQLFFSFLFLVLGFLSKPNIIFLPFLFIAYGFIFHSHEKRKLQIISILFLSTLLIPVYFYFVSRANIQHKEMTVSPLAYFLTQTQVLFVYLRLMMFPVGLKFAYDFTPPENLISNIFWIYLLVHISFFTIVCIKLKDTSLRFWFASIYLAFLPESGFFPIMHLAFEHRTFLPMIFVFIFLSQLQDRKDLIHAKKILIFLSALAVVFISLNQLRNREIKDVNQWKLHTLRNSNTLHAVNFKFSIDLMESGRLNELKPVLENYDRLYPDVPLYGLLHDIYAFYSQGKSKEGEEKIANWLAGMDLPVNQRQYINFFFLKTLGKTKRGLDDQLLLEDILSRQQKIFHADKEAYKIFLDYYRAVVPSLIAELKRQNRNSIQLLKMKTILQFYYGQKDGELNKEIRAELAKNPENKVLIRLKEMTEQRPDYQP